MSDTATARRYYAEEIKCRGQISSLRLVRAFASVPRERFLPCGPWRIRSDVAPEYGSTADANPVHVYHDVLVAIDEERKLDNGLPSLWARLFDLLDLKPDERIVQVGCGLGYYSAILSEVVGARGKVVAIDCESAFVQQARETLRDRANVDVIHGDGCEDVGGPADAIIVHAGFAHPHPLWLDSLRPHGRLLVPLTNKERQGTLVKVTRQEDGFCAEALGGIEIFPCHGRANTDIDERLAGWWGTISSLAPFRFQSVERGLPSNRKFKAYKGCKRTVGKRRAVAARSQKNSRPHACKNAF